MGPSFKKRCFSPEEKLTPILPNHFPHSSPHYYLKEPHLTHGKMRAIGYIAVFLISVLQLCLASQLGSLGDDNSTATFTTWASGFWSINSPAYQYGPSIVTLDDGTVVALYCSPGSGGSWDAIRATTSTDFSTWTDPIVLLLPQTSYELNSVCDPSLVRFHGVWFLYHTCINTQSSPDGYGNNRICVTMADSALGPYAAPANNVVLQDLECPSSASAAYCVGQPSAIVSPDGNRVLLYFTRTMPNDKNPPNPGYVYVAESRDGVNFSWLNGRKPIYGQRDVDVKYDRVNELFLMVQGDVGSTTISYATSTDGVNFTSFDPSFRSIVTNPSLPSGGSNNNPGLVGRSDGHFDGMTAVVYGSSPAGNPGWGQWKLYASPGALNYTQNNCFTCLSGSLTCDQACSAFNGDEGVCGYPGSTNPTACCNCVSAPSWSTCAVCAPTGCVAACQGAGYRTGICGNPGSTNPSDCCSCLN
jgi:hypothetical protein